jgi:hypothetical protein
VSAKLRGTRDKQKISLGISGAPIEKQDYSKYILQKSFNVSKKWKNYTATFKLPESWTMRNVCFMVLPDNSGEAFFIDNAKLYPNAPPCSSSKKELFGLEFNSNTLGDIFIKEKSAKISISLTNLGNTPQKYSLKIDSVDFWGNSSKLTDRICKVAAKSSYKFKLPVDTSNRGYFTLKYRLSNADGITKTGQFTYSVISDNSKLNHLKFGINFHMERPSEAQLKLALPLLSKIGFGSIRAWWDWANVEWIKGKFNWKTTDLQVELCDKYKLEIIPTILRMYGPRWTVPNKFQTPPDNLSLWDNYLTRTVKRYKGRVKYWEIWNEPDISPILKHKPELYFKLLKRNYTQIKQIDPKAEVIGICGSHMWFFKAAVEANALDYLDIVSYHSYYNKYNPEHALLQWDKNFQTLLTEKYPGKKIRLWNTEVGLVGERGGHVVPEENNARAAALLVHNFVSDFSIGVERSFWFTASMRSLNPHSAFDYDYKLTPMLVAMNALSNLLAGSNYTGRIKLPKDNEFFSFLFDLKDNSSMAVIWFNGFPTTRKIEFINPANTTVMDMMGKQLKPRNRKYQMLSSFPLYLKAKDKKTLISEIQQIKFHSEDQKKNASVKVGKQQKASPTIGPFNLSKDGMIIDWNLFGPFANPGGRGYDTGLDIDFLKKLGGEANANLNMKSSCKYKWPESMKYYILNAPDETTIKSKEYHGSSVADYYGDKSYINFINVLKPEKYVVAYAFCYLEAPEDMNVKIKIGSDDGCKIFLNHKQIWRNKAYRKAKVDDDVIKTKLRKGLNPLLIKISQGTSGWGFYLRITSEDAKNLKKVKIWL